MQFHLKITAKTGTIADAIARKKQFIDAIITKTAFDCQGLAVQNAPVDTGFLKSSIQVVKIGDAHYMVVVGASYGIFLELGTSKQRAQPFLMPAFVTTSRTALTILQKVAAA